MSWVGLCKESRASRQQKSVSTDCPGWECDTNETAKRPVRPQHVAENRHGVSRAAEEVCHEGPRGHVEDMGLER